MDTNILYSLVITGAILSNISVFAQTCKSVDFGKGSIVCECNSTYCDFYDDPKFPNENEFIWYLSSKSGERLKRLDGKITNEALYSFKIRINSEIEFQTMEGFGGSFTDAAGINIKKLSQKSQDNLLRSYFSADGSKYNFGRVPIGGTDFSTRGYSYDDVDGDIELQNFTLANEDLQYKIPIMKRALELNPSLRFLSAAWTAPPWMKNRHSFTGYSYLLEKYYQTYADYIIKFLNEYKNEGLEMWTVSTGNEPLTALIPISTINAMFWSPQTVSKWVIEYLVPSLKKSISNNTGILMLDDQRLLLPWYMIDVKTNYNELLKYIKGIGVHWYLDSLVPAAALSATHEVIPDKFILMTEACTGSNPWDRPKVILGSWSRAERLIKGLFDNINHWVAGWIDWNLALDLEGGPNWLKNNVDAPIIVDSEKDVFYKQPLFYVMAHFSKFIPVSAVRIETKSPIFSRILVTAFKTKENLIIVILYNTSSRNKNVSIVNDLDRNINVELPAYSLNTILYQNS